MKRPLEREGEDHSRVRSRVNTVLLAAAAAASSTATARIAAAAAVASAAYAKPPRQNRPHRPSQYFMYYSNLPDEEFRKTFRVPRELFEYLLECLRPRLEYRSAVRLGTVCHSSLGSVFFLEIGSHDASLFGPGQQADGFYSNSS
jgi:hypothetical protein